jgi:riboflavin synthase
MFTGIVEEIGKVQSAQAGRLVVSAKSTLAGVQPGGSIAVNGVCLTIISFTATSFTSDIMPETLRRTNLGLLNAGDSVNLERPLKFGGEVGGHLVQGHIDGTGKIATLVPEGDALLMEISAPAEVMKYIVPKGFIAVDGVSLTVVEREDDSFWVSLVGYTLKNTTLGGRRSGAVVNLEADIIAKYVEQFNQARRKGITYDFLEEHGFLKR